MLPIRQLFETPRPPPTLAEYREQAPAPGRLTGGLRSRGEELPASDAPRISVVTIVWNGAKTIEATIESVLGQNSPNLEYIIVDGGSTDGTLDIIRRYDARLAFWISEKDRGISDAFNKGVALTTGEIIGILNADDAYAAGAFDKVARAFTENPGAGFTYGDCVFLDGETPQYTIKGNPHYERIIRRRLPAMMHPTIFVRRSVYESVGLFRTDYRIAMDYDFILRMHLAGYRGALIPDVIAYMRLGGASAKQALRGHWECLRSAIQQKQAPVPAVGAFTTAVAGFAGKQVLLKAGADGLVARLTTLRYGASGR